MRCKACEYSLWNLRSRACPECGTPFLPSEYEFVPDSVRFCCPNCGQDYYGTGPKGHLVPDAFNCVRCASPVRMDDMLLLPTAGVEESRTRVDVVPWLDRQGRGFFKRLFGTIGLAMVSPGRLARAMPPGRDAAAWRFALFAGLIYFLIGGGILLLPMMITGLFSRRSGSGLAMSATAIVVLLAIPVSTAIGIGLWSLCSHAIILATGPTQAGLARTAACLCYASAANVLIAIPCLGFYLAPISWIWWAASAAVMLRVAQRVSGWRAALAAVLPPLLVVLALAAWITLWVVPFFQTNIAAATSSVASVRASVAGTSVLGALRRYAATNNGSAPPHALALLADGDIIITEVFLTPARPGGPESTLAGVEVAALPLMPPDDRAAAVQAAARSLPPGTVAHRLGEWVFVYHGIDLSYGSPLNRARRSALVR